MEETLKKVIIVGEVSDSKPLLKYYDNRSDIMFYMCSAFENKGDMAQFLTISMYEIPQINYDCVIITAKSDPAAVKRVLLEEYSVNEEDIIEFWRIYNAYVPLMVCDRVMLNPQHKSFDGLICGLSHTEVGIMTDKLGGDDYTFCNLSVSSQDLYFQYKTIEYCVNKYPHKLAGLKYAIIETYDYNYFNFDTSKGKAALEYLAWGGYNMDAHNFNDNHRYEFNFDQAMEGIINKKYGSISEKNIELWEQYCKDVFAYADFKGFCGNFDIKKRTSIVTDKQIDQFFYNRSVLVKFFAETIKENISMLDKIMELLKSISPDVKIYTVIVPKLRETQNRDRERMQPHKEYYNNAIGTLRKKHGFTHLDFSEHEIADHRNFYFDAAHLNLFGAEYFTRMLNDIIFGDGSLTD